MSDAGNARDEQLQLELDLHEPPPAESAASAPLATTVAASVANPPSPSPANSPSVANKPKRIPIRRRPMPCPHCDAELPRELAASPDARCPSCELPLAPVEIAGFWRRSGAAIVDGLLLLFTAGPIAWALDRLFDPLPLAADARGLDRWLTLASADFDLLLGRAGPFLVMYGLYYVFMVFWTGRTLGQRLLAMRIVDRHGAQPGLAIAGLRSLAQIAGTLAAALGLLWVAFDSEKRAFHDRVAGTYVVRSA
ncbi:RDD family protein [Nannocystaceae bacterium ST9]